MADINRNLLKALDGPAPQWLKGNDFVPMGDRNPLPVSNYVQGANGVWVPVSENNPVPAKLLGSFVEIGRVLGVTVTPGSRKTVFTFPAKTESDFKEIVIVIRRQDVEHTYKVDVYWYIPDYTISSVIYGEIGIINTNNTWAYAKIPVKTTGFSIFITNDGQADCSYDVYIFGVR